MGTYGNFRDLIYPMSIALETLPTRLLEVRKAAGISQAKCAAKLGVSDKSYKLYELGRREIPVSALIAFAEELEVDATWLLTGIGNSRNPPIPELISTTVAAVVEKLDASLTPDEADKWGKKGEFIFNLALRNGTSPREEAEIVFSTFD